MAVRQKHSRLLRQTAHHEAAHAVLAWKFGLRFKEISITSGDDEFGYVLFRWQIPAWADANSKTFDLLRARRWAERWVQAWLAGSIAEAKYLGRRARFGHPSDDFQECMQLAGSVCATPEAARTWTKWLWLETERSVEQHWHSIQELAKALLDKIELSRRDAVAIVIKSQKDDPTSRFSNPGAV